MAKTAKVERKHLYNMIYFGEQEAIINYGGVELLGWYLGMKSYINREQDINSREVPYSKDYLRKQLHMSNDKFYRLLKLAWECGLVDIRKEPGFNGHNKNIYIINDIQLKLSRIRDWSRRFVYLCVVRSSEVRKSDTKYNKSVIDNNNLTQELLHYIASLRGEPVGRTTLYHVGHGKDTKKPGQHCKKSL